MAETINSSIEVTSVAKVFKANKPMDDFDFSWAELEFLYGKVILDSNIIEIKLIKGV
jgi:hypothetical protein